MNPTEQLIRRLESARPGTYLLVGHPAYDTEEMRLLGHDGYPSHAVVNGREWEREQFIDEAVLSCLSRLSIQTISYAEAAQIRN